MSEISENSGQPTLWDTNTSTSSPALEASLWASCEQDTLPVSERLPLASPARISAMRASNRASRARGRDSGKKSRASFESRLIAVVDSTMCCLRTLRRSLFGVWIPFSSTLPRCGLMSSGSVYELLTSARPTSENASSLWPTPCVPNGGRIPKGGSMSLSGQTPDGKKRQVDLNYAVRNWPTPAARDWKSGAHSEETWQRNARPPRSVVAHQENWRTPQAHDAKSSHVQSGYTTDLTHQVLQSQIRGNLNPDWVEPLMGYPEGWTSLNGLPDLEKPQKRGNRPASPRGRSKTA